jgi:tetratricopeptide (TPR) repeat protein
MNPQLCVVQIETVEGVFLGSGFFISKTRILSCSHVLGTKHASEIVVRWRGEKRQVEQYKNHPDRDVVCLVLVKPFSIEPEIIEWTFDTPSEGREVLIFGYNKPEVHGLEHLTRYVRGYAADYDLYILDHSVLRGFSGSPACIDNAFVGMVGAKDEARTFLIPATAIRTFAPEPPSKIERPIASFPPSLHNQTPPEPNFVGQEAKLETITEWYNNPEVRIGALIGWGGVGKSALVRKWYDELDSNNIKPDGIFWWGFYRNAYLEQFLNALLRFVSQGRIEPETIKSTWEKTDRIKESIHQGAYLIILDGLEQMQKSASGDEFGTMIHRECTELLHYFADVPKGLCLITARYPVKDLDEWHERSYKNLPLIDLSVPDSLLMLRRRGVKGSEEDMTEVITRYKGHALSLTSVAGYLNRYYDGDIKQAPDVKFVLSDRERFKDVNKLLRKYAEKMSDSERIFLYIFSLFRTEVTENDFAIVFRHKVKGTEFNKVLVRMHELDFRDLISGLVDWRLISYDKTKKTYTTHPLIKGYFESTFDEKIKKLCHKHIYQYFGLYAPEWPETLDEMQPLFEQVYHGCAAGLYDDAWETNLSLARTFFPEGDLSRLPLVSKKIVQSWLLNEAGLALLNLGRPKDAVELLVKKTNMEIGDKDWIDTTTGYVNLAELHFRIGDLERALSYAEKARDAAKKTTSDRMIIPKVVFAWILHLMGKSEAAGKEFREADVLQIKNYGYRLYKLLGVQFADFLISMKRIYDALELTQANLEICKSENWLFSISQCHRCLGAIERIRGNHKEAEAHLQKALGLAHKVGMPIVEIEARLESGRLHSDMKRYEAAIRDANEVLKICARTGFKLNEPEAEIVLSKAYMALKDIKHAKTFAQSAYEKAVGMNYRWQEGDAAHLLGEIYLTMGDKVKAREWLEKAVACKKVILDPEVKESETILKSL